MDTENRFRRSVALHELVPLFTRRRWFGLGHDAPNPEIVAALLFSLYRAYGNGILLSKKDAMKAMGVEHLATAQKYVTFVTTQMGAVRVERSNVDARIDLLILTPEGIRRVEAELDQALVDHQWVQVNLEHNNTRREELEPLVTPHEDGEFEFGEIASLGAHPSDQGRLIQALSETLRHVPDHWIARMFLCKLLRFAGRYEEALERLREAHDTCSGERLADVYSMEADLSKLSGKLDDALQSLSAALEALKKIVTTDESRKIKIIAKLAVTYRDRSNLYQNMNLRSEAKSDLRESQRLERDYNRRTKSRKQ